LPPYPISCRIGGRAHSAGRIIFITLTGSPVMCGIFRRGIPQQIWAMGHPGQILPYVAFGSPSCRRMTRASSTRCCSPPTRLRAEAQCRRSAGAAAGGTKAAGDEATADCLAPPAAGNRTLPQPGSPWNGPDHGYEPTSGFRRAYSRDLAAYRDRVVWHSRMRYLRVKPSPDRSTWTVSPSWISPASSARAS